MAQAWVCDNGDGMPAITQVINVGNGDSEVYCAQCWATFVLALADAIRQAMPPPAAQGGPDDDSDDDEDEDTPAMSAAEAQAQPTDIEPEVLSSPKRARAKAAPRARVRGAS